MIKLKNIITESEKNWWKVEPKTPVTLKDGKYNAKQSGYTLTIGDEDIKLKKNWYQRYEF